MMLVFYIFAFLLIWQSFVSLIGGVRFLLYVKKALRRPIVEYTPFASVIIPCRGIDEGFRENINALWRQDYPQYELAFVFDSAADEARYIIENLTKENEQAMGSVARVRCVMAGLAPDSGQKVHNLRAGIRETDARSEVYAFLDTDARPDDSWLRTLVAPLADENVGAATGYRWFVSPRNGIAPLLRSVWNASITSALGANTRRNFCWGGSTAIRRSTFEKLNVAAAWRGALSDDFALTRTLQAAKLSIHFVPRCLLPSYEDCTFGELLEFTTRQVKITRVYAAPLWKIVLWANLVFTIIFFSGIAIGINRIIAGELLPLPLLLVVVIYLLGAVKAALRLRAVRLAWAPRSAGGFIAACAHVLLFPLAAALYLYNALAALFSRRITWRGITYELKSATETVIIRDNKHAPAVTQRTDAT
jgi:cellulose synthase/poly-beta-1,6-N-acetylglucosamine synthase-like glycosyltransferase